jgi:hypothetical protein
MGWADVCLEVVTVVDLLSTMLSCLRLFMSPEMLDKSTPKSDSPELMESLLSLDNEEPSDFYCYLTAKANSLKLPSSPQFSGNFLLKNLMSFSIFLL